MIVLTVNAGSSSIRLATLETDGDALRQLTTFHGPQDPSDAEGVLADFLRRESVGAIHAIVHRIVHGGEHLVRPCRITAAIETEIERLAPLAPLHNPAALAWIRACRARLGADLPQVAVFDTAFYADLPQVACRYAVPRSWWERFGLRRYGFHGLAHEAMWRRWRSLRPEHPPGARVISLQLGAGCSITAVREGQPLDTSMGFSPLEGLVMATRSGDIDPGLLLYLQRSLSMTPERMERLLNEESGLLGLSGVSADMRTLLASNEAAAQLAVALYCYRARKYVGAYLAVLGGVDAILFGGGVGENAPAIRESILERMHWAGIDLDPQANRQAVGATGRISRPGERPEVWVVPVDEATLLAEHARAVLGPPA